REVHQDSDVAGLSGEARPAPARHDGCSVLAADAHRLDDVVDRPRDDDPDRQHPIVGAAGRVERAVARAEADLGLGRAAELVLERADVDLLGGDGWRCGAYVGLGRHPHFSSRPCPARERSGRSAPLSGSSTPSKSMPSTRTWSWKYSMWRNCGTAQQTCALAWGAQCADTSTPYCSASAAALRKPV